MIPVIGPERIARHLSIEALHAPAEAAFLAISRGQAQAPVAVLHPTDRSDIHVKSAVLPGCPIFTVKMAGWSGALAEHGEAPTSGLIAVFDSATCRPLAILQDEHLISDCRTAAAGAVVLRRFAPRRIDTACVIGTGTQARLQAEALMGTYQVKRLAIWGRDQAKSTALADHLVSLHPNTLIVSSQDLDRTVCEADIVVTATAAQVPVVRHDWLRPGQIVLSVGSDDANKCEIDPVAFGDAKVIVDSRTSAQSYGSTRYAVLQGHLSPSSTLEIGEMLEKGNKPDATRPVIVCLTGLGIQDLLVIEALWPDLSQDIAESAPVASSVHNHMKERARP